MKSIIIKLLLLFIGLYVLALIVEANTNSTYDETKSYDYLVIPGSLMNDDGSPSLMMEQRIDAAEQIIDDNPEITIVASGAQGSNEVMTEAQAIKNELNKRGYQNEILLETKATSTFENLKYSKEFTDGQVVIISQQFHLFRIKILLKRLDLNWDVARAENEYLLPLQPFYREPFAIVKSFVFDR